MPREMRYVLAVLSLWPKLELFLISLYHLGQNLAREWGRLRNPADRVKLWYQESSNCTFGKFSTSVVPNYCSKPPCRKYTQVC